MTNMEIIDLANERLFDVYRVENLVCLSDNNYQYRDVNVLGVPVSNFDDPIWNSTKNLWDLIVCTQDVKYFTGQLFLHLPYINNPIEDIGPTPWGKSISYYYQNMCDRRYCMFVSCCYEKLYNYWDRVGDLLHSFFHTLMKISVVDFSKMIEALFNNGERDEDFMWLKAVKDNEFNDLNKYRKNVVHYYQYESSYRFNHNTNATNLAVIEGLWKEKKNFPDYFEGFP